MKKIDLGCGEHKKEGYIGIDIEDYGQEYVRDLEKGLPFDDNSVDAIWCQHVLEHIKDLKFLMNEIWRVLKPDGILEIIAPHRDSSDAYRDPTHVRYFDEKTMDFYCGNMIRKESKYGLKANFKILECITGSVTGGEKEIYWKMEAIK